MALSTDVVNLPANPCKKLLRRLVDTLGVLAQVDLARRTNLRDFMYFYMFRETRYLRVGYGPIYRKWPKQIIQTEKCKAEPGE